MEYLESAFYLFLRYGSEPVVAALIFFILVKFFLPGYLGEKGKNLATREDFDTLLDQIKKTTKETENIRIELSSRNWLNQQQWALREKYYMGLLEHLSILRLTLQERSNYYLESGSELNDRHTDTNHFVDASQRGFHSFRIIQELVGPSAVFLSDKTIAAIKELSTEHWNVSEFSICKAEYLDSTLKLVDIAYSAILEEAKQDLKT